MSEEYKMALQLAKLTTDIPGLVNALLAYAYVWTNPPEEYKRKFSAEEIKMADIIGRLLIRDAGTIMHYALVTAKKEG